MKELGPEYFWRKYEEKYFKVCKDFNLKPTKTVHLAMDGNRPVGIRSLLRALWNHVFYPGLTLEQTLLEDQECVDIAV